MGFDFCSLHLIACVQLFTSALHSNYRTVADRLQLGLAVVCSSFRGLHNLASHDENTNGSA